MSARAIKGGELHGPGALDSRSQEGSKADIERSRGLERSPEIFLLQKACLDVIPTQPELGYRGRAGLGAGGAVCQPPEMTKCPVRVSFCEGESGRGDSNPRRPAWKAYRSRRCGTVNGKGSESCPVIIS